MATPEVQEAAAKERIITHMNADHYDSVRRYLEAFNGKSFYQVRNARMTDITLNDMRFSCGGQQAIVPFDPPMKSLREARERLVQLDKDALQALGRSDIVVTKYIPPWKRLPHLTNFLTCAVSYGLLCRESNCRIGYTFLFDNDLIKFPAFVNFALAVRLPVFLMMIGIHSTESIIMARKLRKHGVTPLEGIWWLWIGSAFVEGVTAFWRLNGFIEEKQKEKDAKKH